ncbi:hypothetical protein JOD64_002885 [Micromonospora luteifusca]|uniref:Uncharacterized protein n=1 Tax=Micromonospora luteifusca TaxID=709860 RepID=A0ABS2LUZ4_9ACTN|nr:hypothetical protein [Micromonospora luteifusca]MBM7491663.1 hypothetical protein [Micromonospora luteifusca]
MGMSVEVWEYTGVVVEQLTDASIESLCSLAASEPSRYPLLSGVDPYDNTWFNSRQTARLAIELQSIIERSKDDRVRAAGQAILQLASLLEIAPRRPHHRQLLFNGD